MTTSISMFGCSKELDLRSIRSIYSASTYTFRLAVYVVSNLD